MSLYSLHIALQYTRQGEHGPSYLTNVTLCQDGARVPHSALVALLTNHLGEYAYVKIPAGAVLVNEPSRAADYTDPQGWRHYDFASHEDALAFMAELYGLDAHDAALLAPHATHIETQAAAIPSASPAVSHGIPEVPNPSARNVVLTPPVLLGTTARALFLGNPLIHTRRITQ
ncbi:hypothetical protein ACFO0U_04800 [Chromohalobacter sarecensis]|uniref:Uncharacterized protein n=1 Tax=Chromohalobacter sarecensis TaxID=245294 RepID=A0ABV9D0A7_9GAMM|nr:hypothetical protein [Chromohalobacter sarecensis]MCK0713373.1 hypothetical protein [Chromohalobacter sarecensis]